MDQEERSGEGERRTVTQLRYRRVAGYVHVPYGIDSTIGLWVSTIFNYSV